MRLKYPPPLRPEVTITKDYRNILFAWKCLECHTSSCLPISITPAVLLLGIHTTESSWYQENMVDFVVVDGVFGGDFVLVLGVLEERLLQVSSEGII